MAQEIKKQFTLHVPLTYWKAARDEAARQNVPMIKLIRQWIDPHVKKIMARNPE